MTERRDSVHQLELEILDLARTFSGRLTLTLLDLESKSRIDIDENSPMATASVIKMFILGALYERIEGGDIALTTRCRFREEHRTLGSGILSYLDEGVEMSVRDAAMLMIGISDNSASNMCFELAGGVDAVNAWCRTHGFPLTTAFGPLGDPSRGLDGRDHYVTTAAESARLLERLARQDIVSEAACEDMLRILRRNQKREKLARHLPWTGLNFLPHPRQNWVAHKGGTYMSVRNDVALFHGPRGQVIVSAFTENGRTLGADHEGAILLADVGKLVWETLVTDGRLPSERDHIG